MQCKHLFLASILKNECYPPNIQSNYIIHKYTMNTLNIVAGSNVSRAIQMVSNHTDPRIVLMREPTVIMWLYGDLSFLPPIEKKNKTHDDKQYKILEDEWGQTILRNRRPDLKLDKQWTGKFGEHLFEELQILIGKPCKKPENKEHYEPDFEVDDCIWEVKTGTYYTSGTAHEKIPAAAFKYAEVPQLYGKCLKIICIGGAEKRCREEYGNLPGVKCSEQKKKFLDFYLDMGIEFVAATDIINRILDTCITPPNT